VVLHATSARTALMAYCTAEDAALQDVLAAIPFRLPYRDWVQVLKALQHLPDEPEKAAGILARIEEASAFRYLRQAAHLAHARKQIPKGRLDLARKELWPRLGSEPVAPMHAPRSTW